MNRTRGRTDSTQTEMRHQTMTARKEKAPKRPFKPLMDGEAIHAQQAARKGAERCPETSRMRQDCPYKDRKDDPVCYC